MSGVYIKGMQMPKAGQEIQFAENVGGTIWARLKPSFDDGWHEVVCVPDHGRLIDADALASEMKYRQDAAEKWLKEAKDREIAARADGILSFLCELKLTLDKAPTVLPVDKEEDNG